MYRILDQLGEPHLSNGPATLLFVDHGGLLQLHEAKTHGLSVGHAFHLPDQLVVKPSLSGEGTVHIPVLHPITSAYRAVDDLRPGTVHGAT